MALTNPKIFGLNVRTLLADVENKNAAIQNLGINPLDLEIIKGSTNAGMSRFDWVSFSRLKTPIYRTLDRFSNESGTFIGILRNRAGTDQTLFGNLDINGSISGTAIRYRYRDFSQSITVGNFNAPAYRIADISTSRVSAWSSADPRASDPNPDIQKLAKISYGARVGIVEEGKLEFGTQSDASGIKDKPRLQTNITPEVKEFPSEVPTSRIKCKIGTEIVYLYAMKGIPLVFKGFFRNINASAVVDISATKASWKIVETANENLYTNYTNQGAATSSISYRSPISRERFIKLYKNPNEIQQITIRSANLRELPATKLINCNLLDFAYNQLKTFPNFAFIAPNLFTLNIMRNPFYLSDVESERTFNSAVLAKIPTTLTTLNMEGTFYGSIERNIISARLPNLVTFNCGRGGGAYFHPDTRSPDGSSSFCPDVPGNVTSYQIQSNDFRNVDNNSISPNATYTNGSYSYKQLPNLTSLNVNGNYYLGDGPHSLASANSISSINYSATAVAIPNNLQGKTNLTNFTSTYNRNSGNQLVDGIGTYLFSGCLSLGTLHFYATGLGAINFPTSFSNPALSYLDLRYTGIKGGKPNTADGSQEYVIYPETFKEAVSIRYILIDSGNLGSGFPIVGGVNKNRIHPDAFLFNPELYYIWYRSYGKTTGDISQLFSSNPNLQYVWMQSNAFTGTVPNFVSNPNIRYVNLQYNQLSGTIPGFKNLNNLRSIYLQNNNLTAIGEPESLPNLYTYQAPNNQLAGQIPDFSGCTNLRSLTLRNNLLTSYKVGAFAKLYRMNFIDLKFNNLTQTDLDNILVDLVDNWTSINRGGVSINLKNQTNSSGSLIFPSEIGYAAARTLVSKGWSIGLSGGIPPEPADL